jgi:hypothetical protein
MRALVKVKRRSQRCSSLPLVALSCAALLGYTGSLPPADRAGPMIEGTSTSAQLRSQASEAFRAAVYIDGQPAPERQATVDMVITRWTTPKARSDLLAALTVKGEQQMRTHLSRQRPTGYVQLTTGPRYELKYAWQEQRGGRRRVVLISDRIVPFVTVWNATHNFKYRMTAFELRLDEEGRGNGTAEVGVTISVPPETLELVVENPSADTIELREIVPIQ